MTKCLLDNAEVVAALQQICGVCMPALVHRQIGNTAFLQEGLVSAIIPIVCHKSSVVPWKYINGFAGQRSKQFAHIWVDSDYTGMSRFCLFRYSVEFCVSDIRQMSRMVQFSAHVLA